MFFSPVLGVEDTFTITIDIKAISGREDDDFSNDVTLRLPDCWPALARLAIDLLCFAALQLCGSLRLWTDLVASHE